MALKDFFASKSSPATDAVPASASPAPDANAAVPPATEPPSAREAAPPPRSALGKLDGLLGGPDGSPETGALNSQIVQAVQLSNKETAAYAASQIAVPPNMMITQASGLVAQSAANYFDGASKLALASKSVLLKNMTEKFAAEDIKGAAEDALGILITDLLVGTAAAVAAAAGAIEGEGASFALDKIDQSLEKYQALLNAKK